MWFKNPRRNYITVLRMNESIWTGSITCLWTVGSLDCVHSFKKQLLFFKKVKSREHLMLQNLQFATFAFFLDLKETNSYALLTLRIILLFCCVCVWLSFLFLVCLFFWLRIPSSRTVHEGMKNQELNSTDSGISVCLFWEKRTFSFF